ncbi:MAG: hypothetical protein OXU30_13490, partial [Gammaproteobacteria bacterium]|nr:hypothetical protein [Gammaproteobacteria bacterium]
GGLIARDCHILVRTENLFTFTDHSNIQFDHWYSLVHLLFLSANSLHRAYSGDPIFKDERCYI